MLKHFCNAWMTKRCVGVLAYKNYKQKKIYVGNVFWKALKAAEAYKFFL